MMTLTDQEFTRIRKFIYDYAGINLTEQKRALVVGRLQKLVLQNGFSDFTAYLDWATAQGGQAVEDMINRISTNHTFFFRENAHFEFLKQTALPDIVDMMCEQKTQDLRVWCAAAATGEEPYTLAMLVREFFGSAYGQINGGLLATDISTAALAKAQGGIFSDDRVTHVPPGMKNKYFKKIGPDQWMIADQLKQDVLFRRFNLMNKRWPFKGKFHLIFCRNVMIYFDQKTRNELAAKFHHFLHPGGYLFIGHSETLDRAATPLSYVMPAVYRKEA